MTRMALPTHGLTDSSGRPVTLGTELGRGGEGAVFEVREHPGSVAKVYLSPPSRDTAAKLAAMVSSSNDRLLKLAAWPTSVLCRGPQPAGFLMPRISGFRPAFELYGPKLRLQRFPKADWRFLARAAGNTARVFNVVHSAGHVIGDVNHGNLVIGQDATVRLIDCDSFQITAAGKTWFCEVGVGTHQPPEMQGRSYAGVTRTANHDAFGLAVLIFQLLCLGRHPYSGRFLAAGNPPTIEEAIQSLRFAYGGDSRMTHMAPPPGSLPMDALPSQIRQMFEAAFLCHGVQGGRPTASHWIGALDDLVGSLRQCQVTPSHYHLNGISPCPWCEIEGRSNTLLFPAVFVPGATGTDGFLVLWQQVTAVQVPGPRERMPSPPAVPAKAEAKKVGRRLRRAYGVVGATMAASGWAVWQLPGLANADKASVTAWVIGALALVLMFIRGTHRGPIRRQFKAANTEWHALEAEWAAPPRADPRAARARLDDIKRDYDALQADRAVKLKKLHDNRRASQLTEYLDQFQIAGAKVKGIGAAKAATLQSYGIETAADVVFARVVAVPGFGPKTTQNLVDWRTHLERSFRFDPKRGVSPAEIASIENPIALQRRRLEQLLLSDLGELKTAIQQERATREQLNSSFQRIAPQYGQALADNRAATVFG